MRAPHEVPEAAGPATPADWMRFAYVLVSSTLSVEPVHAALRMRAPSVRGRCKPGKPAQRQSYASSLLWKTTCQQNTLLST
mmetsp:Transcript_104936/g.192357  ORF Transcript_104936/g.192357 Transcript_104936/m.192357 type:complete len:81 (-) Transcript_104936:3-245(-)